NRLEWAGYVHVRPDWDDARRKYVTISPAGLKARDAALDAIAPVLTSALENVGSENVRSALPVLRQLRAYLETDGEETS
ncbi:MAG: MarR family winged helix-turn-helix transcriptional regulator, partial [Pseudomonadota bacterium]